MEMSKRLQQVAEKLQRAQQLMRALETENAELRAANATLTNRLDAWEKTQAKAMDDISVHATEKKGMEQKGVQAVLDQQTRQQIDQYLEEIDFCINWLKQQ